MNDLKELVNRAKKSYGEDTILNSDKDFYYAVGIVSYLMNSAKKLPNLKHTDINYVTLAQNDEMLKRRLNYMFKQTDQIEFLDNWKGILLSEVLMYKPVEDIKHCIGAHECITAGFNYGITVEKENNRNKKIEESLAKAKGPYENDSVQAARRMCLKRNVDWVTGKETVIDGKKINMLQMTHNEFHDYQKTLASKIWNQEIEYDVNDFLNDSKKVNIASYDLDNYNIPTAIKTLINNHMKTNTVYEDHETFFGHIDLDDTHYMAKSFHCDYGIPFRYAGYYRNNDYMMIINYAEGDFDVSLYTDKEVYNNAVIQTHNFYEPANFYLLGNDVWTEDELYSINEKNNPNLNLIHEVSQEDNEEDYEME